MAHTKKVAAATPKPISLRAYARHRSQAGLSGTSAEAVRRAIQSGRLEQSVVIVQTARGKEPKIADAGAADAEWARKTRQKADNPEGEMEPAAEEGPEEEITYNEARRRREIETWRQMRVKRQVDELDLTKRRGELIEVDEARAHVIERYTTVKTRLLGVPSRAVQRAPELAPHVLIIEELIREALEELADGGGE